MALWVAPTQPECSSWCNTQKIIGCTPLPPIHSASCAGTHHCARKKLFTEPTTSSSPLQTPPASCKLDCMTPWLEIKKQDPIAYRFFL